MKRTPFIRLLTCILLLGGALARAQAVGAAPFGLEMGEAAPLQVVGQIQGTHANAPPGQCGCFWMTGGGAQIVRNFRSDWGGVIDVYYGSNSNANGAGEHLSIFNYLAGPRYTYRTSTRYTPYGQLLVGISKVGSNYFVYQSGNSYLAAQAGLGVEMYYKPRIAFVPFEADWVLSHAKNGVNTRQNNLRVGAGVIYRFGPR